MIAANRAPLRADDAGNGLLEACSPPAGTAYATVASADPPSRTISGDIASGLSATISRQLPSGAYFVSVDGVGDQDVPSAYDDYASLGAYRLTQAGCIPG